ncbi:hypothetical protein [Jeotgalicoccus sp. FSL K6-3177]|uniref:hypothetical protein n=1 Tax=Jeotgalicoccus sp. FSL K6-3177 TaxID=2921494 RepID=UPI0030FD77CC
MKLIKSRFIWSIVTFCVLTIGMIITLWKIEDITTPASKAISILLTSLIPMLFLILILSAIFSKRIRVQAERIDISGISLLLDSPEETFRKSMKNFLETKRTLFYINEQFDNFDETLNSYYETYQFIKKEMPLIDINKNKRLYDLCTETIQKLNKFLTQNQNNYRRWFNNVQENDRILYLDNKEIKTYEVNVHLMRIDEVQKYYYNYDEILKGFREINTYFRKEISPEFIVNIEKWKCINNG